MRYLASMMCVAIFVSSDFGLISELPKVDSKKPVWERAIADVDPYSDPIFATSGLLAIDLTATPASKDEPAKTGEIELFDAGTGTQRTRLSWSAPRNSSNFGTHDLVPLSGDKFLLRNWDKIAIVSSTGEILATRTLPLESAQADYNPNLTLWDHWQVASSPDGTTILGIRHHGRETDLHWLSNDTLQDIQVESIKTNKCCSTVSDGQMVYADLPKGQTLIRDRHGKERALCGKCIGGDAHFIDNEDIAIAIKAERRLLVVSTSGEVSGDLKLPGSDSKIYQMSVARFSKRIALLLGPKHFGGPPKAFSAYVYDVAIKKITFEIHVLEVRSEQEIVKGSSSMHFEGTVSPRIALSPDGKRLAVLNQGTLYMYSTIP